VRDRCLHLILGRKIARKPRMRRNARRFSSPRQRSIPASRLCRRCFRTLDLPDQLAFGNSLIRALRFAPQIREPGGRAGWKQNTSGPTPGLHGGPLVIFPASYVGPLLLGAFPRFTGPAPRAVALTYIKSRHSSILPPCEKISPRTPRRLLPLMACADPFESRAFDRSRRNSILKSSPAHHRADDGL
jgi:hypothetical protein